MSVQRAEQADYLHLLLTLLPKGPAWAEDDRLLDGMAEESARLHNRVMDLIDEYFPGTTAELFGEWETEYGLPDPCVTEAQSLVQRRAALVAKVSRLGGQTPQFYIDLAAALGYTITITEFNPFYAGAGAAGHALYGDEWQHAWQVNAPETTVTDFIVNQSTAGDPLRSWGNELLECVLRLFAPAHTYVIFAYA